VLQDGTCDDVLKNVIFLS